MEGSLKDIHLGGLLRLLNLHRFTGALKIEGDTLSGSIFVDSGRIAAVTASSGRPKIGDLLVKNGVLTVKKLEDALAVQLKDKDHKPLGHYLVNQLELCGAEDFHKALEQQMSGTLNTLLQAQQGRFVFEEGPLTFKHFLLRTSTENLLLSGLRTTSSFAAEEALPPMSAILEMAPRSKDQTLDVSLLSDEWNVLVLFDGNRNLEEIVRISGLTLDQAQRIIYSLISTGLLKKIRFKFPDLEKIARDALDNMGLVLVQNAYQNLGISRARMGMRELIKMLNELEKSMALIVGPSKSTEIIELMWEATKR